MCVCVCECMHSCMCVSHVCVCAVCVCPSVWEHITACELQGSRSILYLQSITDANPSVRRQAAASRFDRNMLLTVNWFTRTTDPQFSSFFHSFVKSHWGNAACHCFLPSPWPAVHLTGWRLSEIAVHYNGLGHLGPAYNECCCNFRCHRAMNAPCFFACCPCAESNLHGDINVTVMFHPRAARQNS